MAGNEIKNRNRAAKDLLYGIGKGTAPREKFARWAAGSWGGQGSGETGTTLPRRADGHSARAEQDRSFNRFMKARFPDTAPSSQRRTRKGR